MRGAGLDPQLLHHPCQSRGLPGGQVEHQAGQRGGVDHRVVERRLQPAADQVGVEGVVAVLDQDGSSRKAEEGGPHVTEAGRTDQHRPIDLVPLLGVPVDGRPALHEGVEERERSGQPEALGPDLEDEKGPVPGRLDVERDVLGVLERGVGTDRFGVPVELHERDRPALTRFEGD